jgi:hypothetical protein
MAGAEQISVRNSKARKACDRLRRFTNRRAAHPIAFGKNGRRSEPRAMAAWRAFHEQTEHCVVLIGYLPFCIGSRHF